MSDNFILKEGELLVLFDGVCNLCHSSVQFILQRDKSAKFKFASLQSELGQKLLKFYAIDPQKTDSIVLISEQKAYVYSAAALRIGWNLGGVYKLLALGWLIPYFIRDWVYKRIAKNRYNWWGKKDACLLPRPEWKHRFLG